MVFATNCNHGGSLADWGIVASTEYSASPEGLARVRLRNVGAQPRRVILNRAVVCRLGAVSDRSLRKLGPVDRRLAPGEMIEVVVDGRLSTAVPQTVYVVSLAGRVDGEKACADVAAWIPMLRQD